MMKYKGINWTNSEKYETTIGMIKQNIAIRVKKERHKHIKKLNEKLIESITKQYI